VIYTLRFTAPINQSLRNHSPALKLIGVLVHESPTSLVYLHTAHDSFAGGAASQKEALFALSLTGFRAPTPQSQLETNDGKKRASAITLRQPFISSFFSKGKDAAVEPEPAVLRPLVLYFEYVEQEPNSSLELEISSQLTEGNGHGEIKRYISPRSEPTVPGKKIARCTLNPFDLISKGLHLSLGPVICTITDTKHMPPGRHASSRRTMRFLSSTHCGLEISPVRVTDAQGNSAGYAQLCSELKVSIRAGHAGDPWISCRNGVRMIHRKETAGLTAVQANNGSDSSSFYLSEMGEVRVPLA
jgi:hypothetical protein